jgi:hypothetical protein
VGPHELALVRKSHLGLTGFEIATLSTWIDSAGFPLAFSLPPIMPWTRSDRATSPKTSAVPAQVSPGKTVPAKTTQGKTNSPQPAPAAPPKR